MRIEQQIVDAWAARLGREMVSEVIGILEGMDATLSGDSGLENVWEEVCAQARRGESFDWPLYEEAIVELLGAGVEALDQEAQLALWAVTDEGWDYLYDHHADEDGASDVPLDVGDIVSKLKQEVLAAAAEYESPSLYRYIWGKEQSQYDDEGEYFEDDIEVEEADQEEDEAEYAPVFVIHREQIEAFDLESSLEFLRTLVPLRDPQCVWSWKGTLTLAISGYDNDPRELYEIPEVCRYLRGIDQPWPFWFFFFIPASIHLVGMCLASAVPIAPGRAFLPPENLQRFMERGFAAVNRLFDHYSFPEAENEALSGVVSRVFAN